MWWYNFSADGNYEVRYKSNVLIYPNGEVLWVPPAIYQSSCTIDVTYFPFDQQTCIMKFGSWTFNGDQVSLALYNNKNFVDLSDYWKSGTWDIIEVPAYLNVYSEGNQPTETDITFYIIIRRKTLFYTVNLILPTVLISFLCVLVFYLPAEAGEKVWFCLHWSRLIRQIIIWIFYPLLPGYPRYQYFTVTGCVSVAGVKNSSSYITCASINSQIFTFYFHHEHCFYIGHSCYY